MFTDDVKAKIVAAIHVIMMLTNIIVIPMLIINEPFHIWFPMIVLLASPLLGGHFCIINRLENIYRVRAGKKPIVDRLSDLFEIYKGEK